MCRLYVPEVRRVRCAAFTCPMRAARVPRLYQSGQMLSTLVSLLVPSVFRDRIIFHVSYALFTHLCFLHGFTQISCFCSLSFCSFVFVFVQLRGRWVGDKCAPYSTAKKDVQLSVLETRPGCIGFAKVLPRFKPVPKRFVYPNGR